MKRGPASHEPSSGSGEPLPPPVCRTRVRGFLVPDAPPDPGEPAFFLFVLAPRRFPGLIAGPRRAGAFRAAFGVDPIPADAAGFAGASAPAHPLLGRSGARRCAGGTEIPAVAKPFAQALTQSLAVPFTVPFVSHTALFAHLRFPTVVEPFAAAFLAVAPGHAARVFVSGAAGGASGLAGLEVAHTTRRRRIAGAGRGLGAHVLAIAVRLLVQGPALHFVVDLRVLRTAHRTFRMPLGLRPVVPERIIAGSYSARSFPARGPGISAVRATVRGGFGAFEAEVAPDPLLEIRGDVVVVAEVRRVLDVVFGLGDLNGAVPIVDARDLHRYQSRPAETEEAHLDTDVLLAVGIVHEEIVYFAYPRARVIVDRVALIPLFEFPQPLVVGHASLLLRAFAFMVSTVPCHRREINIRHTGSRALLSGAWRLTKRQGRGGGKYTLAAA